MINHKNEQTQKIENYKNKYRSYNIHIHTTMNFVETELSKLLISTGVWYTGMTWMQNIKYMISYSRNHILLTDVIIYSVLAILFMAFRFLSYAILAELNRLQTEVAKLKKQVRYLKHNVITDVKWKRDIHNRLIRIANIVIKQQEVSTEYHI